MNQSDTERLCATCRYWSASERVAARRPDYVETPTGHRMCALIVIGGRNDRADEDSPDSPAVLHDGSGYAASLYTKAEFGCTLYRGKA